MPRIKAKVKAKDLKGLSSAEWKKRVDSALDRARISSQGTIKYTYSGPPNGLKNFARAFDALLAEAVYEFFKTRIMPYIKGQFSNKSPSVYGIRYIRSDKSKELWGNTIGIMSPNRTRRGFTELERKATDFTVQNKPGRITAIAGKGIYDLRTSQFHPAFAPSELDSWFLAVELGTGIGENVGDPWVRTEGPSKDPEGDGSWRPGRPSNLNPTGPRFLGQKGFHIFWDENSRQPAPIWRKVFRQEFPAFLQKKMQQRAQR